MNRREFLARSGAAGAAASILGIDALAQASRPLGMRFVDVTAAAGIAFHHNNGSYGGKLLPETLGSGIRPDSKSSVQKRLECPAK